MIEIRVPAHAQYAGLIRLAAASACSLMDFDIETLEDVRLATSEMFNYLVLSNSGIGKIDIVFKIEPERLVINGSCGSGYLQKDDPEDIQMPIGLMLIESFVDSFEISTENDTVSAEMIKNIEV